MKLKKSYKYIFPLIGLVAVLAWKSPSIIKNSEFKSHKQDTLKITILQTADIHGQMDPHPELFWENEEIVFKERGGLAQIKTLFDRERAKNPGKTFIVDGGDLIQGSGYVAFSEGEVMADVIKNMNYDLLVPGNWEVIYGKEKMLEVYKNFETPTIVQNMLHENSNENLFPSYMVKEIDGIRLGFVGINDPQVPVRQNPIFSKGIHFTEVDDRVKTLIDQIKVEEKINVMLLITHIGIYKQVTLANSPIAENVDYILGNDTHERVRKPIQGKYAKVTEPGAFGSFVGKLNLYFVNNKLVKDDYELMDVDPEIYPADPKMQAIVDKNKAPYRENLETIVG